MNKTARALASQIWLMEPAAFRRMILRVGEVPQDAIDVAATGGFLAGDRVRIDESGAVQGVTVVDGVAHIPIAGPIMRSVGWVFDWLGIEAASTEDLRVAVTQAVENDSVTSIVLDIDSPGGTIDGLQDLADDIRAARDLKPVSAHTPNMMASAAYWLGSQTSHISASSTASVGSIGVYTVVDDYSAMYEGAGIKTHVVSSHELKGAGVVGAPVTEEQLAEVQRNIDTYAALFVEAVAKGRGTSTAAVEKVATGQVWIGQEALDIGLVDSIGTPGAHTATVSAPIVAMMSPDEEAAAEDIIEALEQSTNAPVSVHEEKTMDPKDIEAMQADNARLQAQADADKANREAQEVAAKADTLVKYADRYMPAAQDAFEAMAGAMSNEQLDAHMASLPKVTLPKSEVDSITVARDRAAGGIASLSGIDPQTGREIGGEAGAKQVARWLQTSVAKIDRYGDVRGANADGTFAMADGSILTREELKARVA